MVEMYEGIIETAPSGNQNGKIKEDNGTTGEFVRGNIPSVNVGERFSFLKIIQETPNGDRVIRILKKKLPI